MDQSTHEVRLAHWKEVVAQCQSRPEGMTAKDDPMSSFRTS